MLAAWLSASGLASEARQDQKGAMLGGRLHTGEPNIHVNTVPHDEVPIPSRLESIILCDDIDRVHPAPVKVPLAVKPRVRDDEDTKIIFY